jgi:hypothetical protein
VLAEVVIGICLFLEATAVTTPPPTTAPTAKHAAWMIAALGICEQTRRLVLWNLNVEKLWTCLNPTRIKFVWQKALKI